MLLDRWADNLQRALSTSVESDGRWVSCSDIQARVQEDSPHKSRTSQKSHIRRSGKAAPHRCAPFTAQRSPMRDASLQLALLLGSLSSYPYMMLSLTQRRLSCLCSCGIASVVIFSQCLENVMLLTRLQSLSFGLRFNQSLENVTLLDGLQILAFDYGFYQSLESRCFFSAGGRPRTDAQIGTGLQRRPAAGDHPKHPWIQYHPEPRQPPVDASRQKCSKQPYHPSERRPATRQRWQPAKASSGAARCQTL